MSAETLRKAAQVLRERGLAKGYYRDESGCVCIKGALRIAHGGDVGLPETFDDYVADLMVVARGVIPGTVNVGGFAHDAITVWNDEPERTAEEVIAALEAAAARLDAS